MRVDCGQLDPGAVIPPVPGEGHPRMPERLDEDETRSAPSICRSVLLNSNTITTTDTMQIF